MRNSLSCNGYKLEMTHLMLSFITCPFLNLHFWRRITTLILLKPTLTKDCKKPTTKLNLSCCHFSQNTDEFEPVLPVKYSTETQCASVGNFTPTAVFFHQLSVALVMHVSIRNLGLITNTKTYLVIHIISLFTICDVYVQHPCLCSIALVL